MRENNYFLNVGSPTCFLFVTETNLALGNRFINLLEADVKLDALIDAFFCTTLPVFALKPTPNLNLNVFKTIDNSTDYSLNNFWFGVKENKK